MTNKNLLSEFEGSLNLQRLANTIAQNQLTTIKGFTGSSLSIYCSCLINQLSESNIFIFNSKEDSLYFLNDIELLNPDKKIFFFLKVQKIHIQNQD